MMDTASLLKTEIEELMIPAANVACVHLDNSVEHALLVLIKSGYSAIPVLDRSSRVCGSISKTRILDSILGLERIEFEQLDGKIVESVMDDKVPRISGSESFFRALELSINHPFICVQDENDTFSGLLTRKAILALVYKYFRRAENKRT